MPSPRILLILARNRIRDSFNHGHGWTIACVIVWVAVIAVASLKRSH